MTVVFDDGNGTLEEALVSGLTHEKPEIRIMARAAAASWSSDFARWVQDEANRPKADHMALLQALAIIQIQSYGSVVAALVGKGGHQATVDLYIEMTRNNLLRHIGRTAEFRRLQEEGTC